MRSQIGNTVLQNAATATGNGTPLNVAGRSSVVAQVSGTFTATVTWEGSVDGTNWIAVAVADLNSTTRARATASTAAAVVMLDTIAGLQLFRARISAYTSGNVTVWANASD